jgi:predicted  nucleic acid-binding Zn-ribbon protein
LQLAYDQEKLKSAGEHNKLEKQISTLSDELQRSSGRNQSLASQNEKFQMETGELRRQIIDHQTTIAGLEQQMLSLRSEITQSQKREESIRKDLMTIESDHQSLQTEFLALQQQSATDRHQHNLVHTTKLQELLDTKAALETDLQETKRQVSDREHDIQALTSAIKKLKVAYHRRLNTINTDLSSEKMMNQQLLLEKERLERTIENDRYEADVKVKEWTRRAETMRGFLAAEGLSNA